MKWRQFVKVYDSEAEASPYYVQWAVWCWRKPIWIGLPLVWLLVPMMVVDVIYGLFIFLMSWAKHR